MKQAWIVLVILCQLFIFLTQNAFALHQNNDPLVLQNTTIVNGQIVKKSAFDSITAGPAYVINSGGNVELRVRPGGVIKLVEGFKATAGSIFSAGIGFNDTELPSIISAWPTNNSFVSTQGGQLSIIVSFGDTDSGIYSVTLLDAQENDITSAAEDISFNSITLTLTNPSEGLHNYTLKLEDFAGNIGDYPIIFTVDNTIPSTSVNITGGHYSDPIAVNFTCPEDATLYYSTDGYPPFDEASNTTEINLTAGITSSDIAIDSFMNLQFFAKDLAGNLEPTHREIYFFSTPPEMATAVSADFHDSQVDLAWTPPSGSISGYYIYRCNNVVDSNILNASNAGGFSPTARLRLASNLITTNSYSDFDLTDGSTYWYGISVVDDSGIEGPISELVSLTITPSSTAQTKEEAIARGVAWLAANQDEQGAWGEKEELKMLHTSQALNALRLTGEDNAGIRQGRFWLRGHFADNNDYLARKIITLNGFGDNTLKFANRLISRSYFSSGAIEGWSIQGTRCKLDAIDTVLGGMALQGSHPSLFTDMFYWGFEFNLELSSNESRKFGWIRMGGSPSIYVSALVYKLVEEHFGFSIFSNVWIVDYPNPDGSWGNGLVDTAAVLLWQDRDYQSSYYSQSDEDNAVNYLVNQQSLNGSWQENPYVTSLCLEALIQQN